MSDHVVNQLCKVSSFLTPSFLICGLQPHRSCKWVCGLNNKKDNNKQFLKQSKRRKKKKTIGTLVQSFKSTTSEAIRESLLNLRPALSTKPVPSQPELNGKTNSKFLNAQQQNFKINFEMINKQTNPMCFQKLTAALGSENIIKLKATVIKCLSSDSKLLYMF